MSKGFCMCWQYFSRWITEPGLRPQCLNLYIKKLLPSFVENQMRIKKCKITDYKLQKNPLNAKWLQRFKNYHKETSPIICSNFLSLSFLKCLLVYLCVCRKLCPVKPTSISQISFFLSHSLMGREKKEENHCSHFIQTMWRLSATSVQQKTKQSNMLQCIRFRAALAAACNWR